MRNVFKLCNYINTLSLFTILIVILFGKNAFLITTDNSIDTVCANQFIVAFVVTFGTYIYAKIKHIAVTRSVYDIFINSEMHIRIIVTISIAICIIISSIYFKRFYVQYSVLCILHSVSILACSAILKQNS